MNLYDVIKKPLVTEKTISQSKPGRYVFEVDLRADKNVIREAIELLFKVKVAKLNTAVVRGKVKRVGRSVGKRSNWKKASVELVDGQKIELFEGV